MSKMNNEAIRDAEARSLDNAGEVADLRAEVAELRRRVADALGSLRSISPADLEEMDGTLGRAYGAMLVRRAIADLEGS